MTVTFERHLDEQIAFAVTLIDALGNRQSVLGSEDLRLTIYRQSDMVPVVANDHANCAIDESGPETAGDVRYSRAPDTVLVRGHYPCKFLCTIAGVPVAFPQQGFITLIIT
jgi:hypothetical protein